MVLEDTKIVVLNIFNTITHMVIGGVTLVAIVFALRPGFSDDFRQHIIMCTVGYIMLMCEAVLTFNSNNAWSHTLYHSQKKVAHLAVQVAGSSLALAGCIIRISGYGGKHFSTAHGVTGWLAFILTFISLIGGVLNLYLKQHDKIIKICHASLDMHCISYYNEGEPLDVDNEPQRLNDNDHIQKDEDPRNIEEDFNQSNPMQKSNQAATNKSYFTNEAEMANIDKLHEHENYIINPESTDQSNPMEKSNQAVTNESHFVNAAEIANMDVLHQHEKYIINPESTEIMPKAMVTKIVSESTFLTTFRLIINIITHILIAVTIFESVKLAMVSKPMNMIQLHIILCVIGYQFFMCQGVLVMSAKNSWSYFLSDTHSKYFHGVFHLLGFVLAAAGTALVVIDQSAKFASVHGLLGIIALVLRISCIFCFELRAYYVVLMSQAVLSLSPYNGWSQTFSYQEKRFMHWVLQIAGSALAITGSIIKIVDTPDNFQTVHGIIGLIALLLTCLSMIGGIINLLFFKVNPKIIKILHASLGLLTLCVAYLSLIFAFSDYSNIFLNGVSNVRLAISLTVVGLGGLVASSIVNIFQRIYS
ncbi:unnamed protein product [Plutella xylostella]|uniref:ascorbate ferrireductase (transmembrane) n=1 Tax=Plutella xylostella TaxID=51655 RepID=A0A8S4F613_PLUXY|nr:unnamed protein product [Plutella xylostella]